MNEHQADAIGAPPASSSPRRLSIPTDDAAIVRRTKSLAAATPIGELERNKARLDGDHWAGYDLTALAFAAIDQVALHMGISVGLGYDDALVYTAGQAARQQPGSPTAEHELVGQKVLDHLIGTEPFTIEYLDHGSGGPVRRTHTFRILYEQWNADSEPYLRATEEAINVLVGGLDIDIASAQIAVEAQLKALIERGALHDAARFAELARYRTITYLEHVRTIIRDTRIDPDAHDWLTDVPAELTAALEHVAERITTEAELRSAVADRRDDLTDITARTAVNDLLATLGDCMTRNAQLQDHLIEARQHLRDAQDARFARRGTSQQRYHLHTDLTVSYLTAPPAVAAQAADRVFDHLGSIRRPFWLHWSDLLDNLLEPPGTDEHGDPLDEPSFDDTDDEAWWEPYWQAAETIIAGITTPVTLTQLLTRLEPIELDDGTRLETSGLAAAVCHLAYGLRGTPLLEADDPGERSILLAVPTGGPIGHPDAIGDDLDLIPATVAARTDTNEADDIEDVDQTLLEGTLL